MSLSARRESLLKSSISIKSMRDSVAKFNKGLNAAKKSAIEIVKNTKESNLFKRTLISVLLEVVWWLSEIVYFEMSFCLRVSVRFFIWRN